MRILVAGATGETGRRLVHHLARAGHEPVAMVREGSDLSVLPNGCETRKADLTNLPEDIVRGVDAVVFAAGSGADTSEAMTEKVDRDGAIALINAAEAENVRRFVMLSSVGADDPDQGPDEMRHYLVAKQLADEWLKGSELDYAIVRPVALTDKGGRGEIESSTDHVDGNEIARGDVAAVLALCATTDAACRRTFEIAKGSTPVREAVLAIERRS